MTKPQTYEVPTKDVPVLVAAAANIEPIYTNSNTHVVEETYVIKGSAYRFYWTISAHNTDLPVIEKLTYVTDPITQATTTEKFTLFWRGPFSNWYIRPFIAQFPSELLIRRKGKLRSAFDSLKMEFNCVEQYVQFCKAVYFSDFDAAGAILQTNDPSEQEKIGCSIVGYDEAIWDEIQKDVLIKGCYAKFSQHDDLYKMLISTEGTSLVCCSGI